MKNILTLLLMTFATFTSSGQTFVKTGDITPKYYFPNIINAPYTSFNLTEIHEKPLVVAFWGTWCAPCIPEMIQLAALKKQFGDKIQVLAVSNDSEQKIKTFLQKRPSKIWFASDPSNNLWNLFNIEVAGHAVLIDKNNKIAAITETHTIDSSIIRRLIDGQTLQMEEQRGDKQLPLNQDPIQPDSATLYSFVLQPAKEGVVPMMKKPRVGAFGGRRITIINRPANIILREAFDVATDKKVAYASVNDSIRSFKDTFCVDLIVPEKTILSSSFRKELNAHLPIKCIMEKRVIDCYVLQPINGKTVAVEKNQKQENVFSYNGLGFDGEGVQMKIFVTYLENVLNVPIYDATGLTEQYNISFTKNNVDRFKSTAESLSKLGLELVNGRREMDVLVISSR